jgi:small subunit ribosomal protein S8
MSQDTVADALNQMMNAKRAKKNQVIVNRFSKTLLGVLAIGKLKNYVSDFSTEGRTLTIGIGKMNACKAVKPRYVVKADMIEKYVRRYLPARDLGVVIISTSQGLMTHQTAMEKGLGGSIIAYFY